MLEAKSAHVQTEFETKPHIFFEIPMVPCKKCQYRLTSYADIDSLVIPYAASFTIEKTGW